MARDYETEPSEEAEGGPVKSFLEHLEDFRWVLIKSLVSLGVAMLICLMGANYVVAILKWPTTHNLVRALAQQYNWRVPWAATHPLDESQVAIVSFGTNHVGDFQFSPEERAAFSLGTNHFVNVQIEPLMVGTNLVLGWHAMPDTNTVAEGQQLDVSLVNLSPAGAFFVAFQVAFYGGMVLASPFILYFIASFVFPALRMHERKHVYRALFFGCGLFITGVCFCYFVLMPVALAASQMYSSWLGFGAYQWRAEDYISFVCKFMLGMGLGFELPVVVLTLVKIDVLSYSTLKGARRYMIVINLVLGAVLTTPEVVTQLLMFVPLQLLYEITVWIAWYWDRQEKKRAEVETLKS
ncbi:MAG TPA: twin-arginine translocase subunit TatC [Verrucomicrobiae bacterium]|jgi:sec-independent protein translocase protein TatC